MHRRIESTKILLTGKKCSLYLASKLKSDTKKSFMWMIILLKWTILGCITCSKNGDIYFLSIILL